MNECKVDNVDLLLFIMKPVELISKLFTVCGCMFSDVCYERDVLSAFFTVSLVLI